MLEYILLIASLVCALLGIVYLCWQLLKLLFAKPIPMIDCSYKGLHDDISKIIDASQKYGSRIRGSVRLSQGRIASIEEIKKHENDIVFP